MRHQPPTENPADLADSPHLADYNSVGIVLTHLVRAESASDAGIWATPAGLSAFSLEVWLTHQGEKRHKDRSGDVCRLVCLHTALNPPNIIAGE